MLGPRHLNGHPGHVRRSRADLASGPPAPGPATPAARARLVAALVLALAACSGPSHQVGSPTSTPPAEEAAPATEAALPLAELAGLAVEIRQSRSDWAARVVQLRVVNGTGAELSVTTAGLTAATVEGTATWEPTAPRRVPEGRHRDLSVPLGPPRCSFPPGEQAGPSVTLGVTDAEGRTARLDVVPADPQGHLLRIHGEDCAGVAVREAADVGLDRLSVEDRDGALIGVLELSVTPRSGGPPLGISRIDGTVLLAPVGGTSWSPPELALVTEPTTVLLELVPARCDAHAVAEDKRGTFLGLHTTVDGVAQPVVYLDSGDELRGELHDYLARACGWG